MGDAEVIYDTGRATLIHADVFDGLRFLEEAGVKVDVCVTSPPY